MNCKKKQAVKEKMDVIGRYEKMAAERDRLIKDRTSIQKHLQDKERQLEELLREVSWLFLFNWTFVCYFCF